jgi:hypothetical protein
MRRASQDLSDPDRNMAESNSDERAGTTKGDIVAESGILKEDDKRIFTPPPRIAARIYKPTNNSRRRTSAASSRRNSISSQHSQQSYSSSRSYHGGPHSNHVAQHLRRASILEDRKARLADRAAHAEKVRLRAALAKAAPRSTNNFEERALAAAQAREKNLAEIVANCAEEVKRAKGIAESIKEKREAENQRLRQEMEERLAEAERRREEILGRQGARRGRSLSKGTETAGNTRKSLSPMHEVSEAVLEPISEETAAVRLQRRWRTHQRWKTVKAFNDLGLSIERIKETSFEEVTSLLSQERVVLGTARILNLCGLEDAESGSVKEMAAVRTFLSAFLILGHPGEVLTSKGEDSDQEQVGIAFGVPARHDDLANPQLQDLVAKARDLLISFQNVLSRLSATNNYTGPFVALHDLSEAYTTFFNAFIAWKSRDSATLIEVMLMQLVELEAIWQSVKDSTEAAVTEVYRKSIKDSQVQLIVRIKRLAGPAEGKRLIENAIREVHRQTAKKPAKRRVEGSASPWPRSITESPKNDTDTQAQPLTPPATPQRDSKDVGTSSHEDAMQQVGSILPDNRTIMHELLINKEYRISTESLDTREHIKKVVFDTMRQEIQAGNHGPWILAMAENVRGRLEKIVGPNHDLYQLIHTTLDSDTIMRDVMSGSFNLEKFFSFLAAILPQISFQALMPTAKDTQRKLLVEGDFVDKLDSALHFFDLMSLHSANSILLYHLPSLLEQAIPYEQKQFAQDLASGRITLDRTERWWRSSRAKVLDEVSRRDPEGVNLPRTRPPPDRFYAQMLVDIVTSFDSIDKIPETLQLDLARITRIRTEVLHIVSCGAILLQSKNLLKRDHRSQWKTEAARVTAVLEAAKTVEAAQDGIQAAIESSRSMPPATKSQIRKLVSGIVSSTYATLESGAPIREPVMRLLLSRLHAHVFQRLAATSAPEKAKVAQGASEALVKAGMPEFVVQVRRLVEELERVGEVDKGVHAGWYEGIARRVEAVDGAGQATPAPGKETAPSGSS